MLLQWFGEQSEAVKLALIGLLAGGAAGLRAVWVEWRRPVLQHSTTPGSAPALAPIESAIIDELAGIQFQLAEISKTLKDGVGDQKDQVKTILEKLGHVAEEVRDVREEVRVFREVSVRHP